MDAERCLHLASGESAAGVVRETLARLGRDEGVIANRDAFNVGPLDDVDAGAAGRIVWWTRLFARPLDHDEAKALDDSEVWAESVSS